MKNIILLFAIALLFSSCDDEILFPPSTDNKSYYIENYSPSDPYNPYVPQDTLNPGNPNNPQEPVNPGNQNPIELFNLSVASDYDKVVQAANNIPTVTLSKNGNGFISTSTASASAQSFYTKASVPGTSNFEITMSIRDNNFYTANNFFAINVGSQFSISFLDNSVRVANVYVGVDESIDIVSPTVNLIYVKVYNGYLTVLVNNVQKVYIPYVSNDYMDIQSMRIYFGDGNSTYPNTWQLYSLVVNSL